MAKDRAPTIAAWAAIIAALGNVGAMAWTQKPWWIAGEDDKKEIEEGRKAIQQLELYKLREAIRAEAEASAHHRPVFGPPAFGPLPSPLPLPPPPEVSSATMAVESVNIEEPSILPRMLLSVVLMLFGIGFFVYKKFRKTT